MKYASFIIGIGMVLLGGFNVAEDIHRHAPRESLTLSVILVVLGGIVLLLATIRYRSNSQR